MVQAKIERIKADNHLITAEQVVKILRTCEFFQERWEMWLGIKNCLKSMTCRDANNILQTMPIQYDRYLMLHDLVIFIADRNIREECEKLVYECFINPLDIRRAMKLLYLDRTLTDSEKLGPSGKTKPDGRFFSKDEGYLHNLIGKQKYLFKTFNREQWEHDDKVTVKNFENAVYPADRQQSITYLAKYAANEPEETFPNNAGLALAVQGELKSERN